MSGADTRYVRIACFALQAQSPVIRSGRAVVSTGGHLMKAYVTGAVSALSMIVATSAVAEPTAEVLHYWTSGGEAKSVAVLQKEFADKGGSWRLRSGCGDF